MGRQNCKKKQPWTKIVSMLLDQKNVSAMQADNSQGKTLSMFLIAIPVGVCLLPPGSGDEKAAMRYPFRAYARVDPFEDTTRHLFPTGQRTMSQLSSKSSGTSTSHSDIISWGGAGTRYWINKLLNTQPHSQLQRMTLYFSDLNMVTVKSICSSLLERMSLSPNWQMAEPRFLK